MAKRKIKKYKVSPEDSLCLAVSVVQNPAVESDFQFFSEQKIEKFVGVEGERRMIYGCALRPDFPIYRNNGEEEYYLEFSKEAIDKISKNYFKMGFQTNWTESHKDEVEGLTVTESWIKESLTQDKSVALGLDPSLPVGTWFIGCYCENDEIWKAVKEGNYHGFSIEAIVGVEEFEKQVNNEENMNIENQMSYWTKFKEVLTEVFTSMSMNDRKEEEVELHQEPVAEPTVETTVEEPKAEEPVVEEPKTVEEPKVEEPKEEPKAEEPKTDGTAQLEELIKSLKDEINALKESNNSLSDKVKEMSKQPSTKPLNTNAKPSGADTYSSWRETMRGLIG